MKPERKNNPPSREPAKGPAKAGPSSGTAANQPLAETEPTAGKAQAPMWLIVLFGLLFYWAQLYLDNYAGGFNPQVYSPYRSYQEVSAANPKSGPEALIAKGEALYGLYCVACHQANGLGTPGQFPPLAGSEWVLAPNPARLIRILLNGPTGPFKVRDVDWNPPGTMPPIGSAFPPEEVDGNIAAILSFVRQNWGNKAPPMLPEQVKAVREETSSRTTPWTMDELLKIPDTP